MRCHLDIKQKQQIVERYNQSGLSLRAFAKEVGLKSESQLRRWKKEYDLSIDYGHLKTKHPGKKSQNEFLVQSLIKFIEEKRELRLTVTEEAYLSKAKILVVGAGGLGCELLKDLALCGFKDIHVIDMDTIDVSNLNRQFLFRSGDVGKPKSQVAAEFVNARVPGVNVQPHFKKIQDFGNDFYKTFNLVVCGLDNLAARRWISALLVQLVEYQEDGSINPDTIIPLIDGGSEGFRGHVRVYLPRVTPCVECTIDLFPPKVTFPMCTIANTPRLPEHCIEWASILEWPKVFPDTKKDNDNPEHVNWIYKTALERAKIFNISGVTLKLTQGVIKNIIPAIASTNAIVSAACTLEAFKLVTRTSNYLDNMMEYTGSDGIYLYAYHHEPNPQCPVCGSVQSTLKIKKDQIFKEFFESFIETNSSQFKTPSFRSSCKTLYMQSPASLEEATRPNLSKTMSQLLFDGDTLTVTDPNFPFTLSYKVSLTE